MVAFLLIREIGHLAMFEQLLFVDGEGLFQAGAFMLEVSDVEYFLHVLALGGLNGVHLPLPHAE